MEIDLWLHAGFDVVVNGSRAHLPQAQARYGKALLPICLQVSPDILRQRLQGAAGVKAKPRLPLAWRARPVTPLLTVISSIMTEVCYSQSIPY
ncbi:ribose 1,5-bisphosphokinase [Citrobacter koseri]|uniref:Ribose 1,5-bisphosphokinase n=1 Tax=Citrobacter koseri TaxID=545 RepID=A0A2X2VQ91_CITKO|nr:ribose 1,5-bisphosphokinase [Citrobacter koseri]